MEYVVKTQASGARSTVVARHIWVIQGQSFAIEVLSDGTMTVAGDHLIPIGLEQTTCRQSSDMEPTI
jgi:hypothetical protein